MHDTEKREMWEWIKSILVAIVLALVIRSFIMEAYQVRGQSMLPTMQDRERLIVSKIQDYYREPLQGEIIVFKLEDRPDYIKRVIGVAGDEVRVDIKGVFVNGILLEEPYVLEKAMEPFGPVTVPENTIFVMGDNRNNSMDSRHPSVGFVPLGELKGRAVLVFWPLKNIRIVKHP